MSIPAKSYSLPGLRLTSKDVNPWLIVTKNYSECVINFYSIFNTRKDLEKELSRADINTVCKKELDDMRSVAPEIRYKEVLGHQEYSTNNDYYEELTVKNLP